MYPLLLWNIETFNFCDNNISYTVLPYHIWSCMEVFSEKLTSVFLETKYPKTLLLWPMQFKLDEWPVVFSVCIFNMWHTHSRIGNWIPIPAGSSVTLLAIIANSPVQSSTLYTDTIHYAILFIDTSTMLDTTKLIL